MDEKNEIFRKIGGHDGRDFSTIYIMRKAFTVHPNRTTGMVPFLFGREQMCD